MSESDLLAIKSKIKALNEQRLKIQREIMSLERDESELAHRLAGVDQSKEISCGDRHPSGYKDKPGNKMYKHHMFKLVFKLKLEPGRYYQSHERHKRVDMLPYIGKALQTLNELHGEEYAYYMTDGNSEIFINNDTDGRYEYTMSVYYKRKSRCCEYMSPDNDWSFEQVPVLLKFDDFIELH